ncbi:MAG: rRNA maturation RNase YbeY [Deltaproteobacteria bacterium]|nr:rRNA maturation RNase YbeY [Deltaproteobacteria bacterium]
MLGLKNAGIEITLVTDAFMKKQNKKFMNKNKTTDVLSFPQINTPPRKAGRPSFFNNRFLGDVLVNLDAVKKQAMVTKTSLSREVLFLITHSLLHLLGYDHAGKAQEKKMQAIERAVFCKLYKSAPRN